MNIAGVGLHFLHILPLKNKTERCRKQNSTMHNKTHRSTSCRVTDGLFTGADLDGEVAECWYRLTKGGYTKPLSDSTQKMASCHFGINFSSNENSYLNVISFFCARNTNPAKNTTITMTTGMYNHRRKPAVRETRLRVC